MGVNIQAPGAEAAAREAAPAPAAPPPPEPPKELTPEEQARADKKKAADVHKEKGNSAYKSKNFDEAVCHYEAAIEAMPEEMTYYNNLAAVYFEQKKHELCIETCKKAVAVGRENRADYKIVAKSFARIGNAYKAMEKMEEAIRAYASRSRPPQSLGEVG